MFLSGIIKISDQKYGLSQKRYWKVSTEVSKLLSKNCRDLICII